ncbi:MAG: hypothetical protein JWQ14_2480 [Adhaeribacter sp.]|nr:hypothetical protein [Adhaeribacter sp.]
MNKLEITSFLLLLFLGTAFTFVHHGWANYDQEKPLDYTGTVQEAVYENPHATAKVSFNKKVWTVVLAPTSRMQERGATADLLQKGTSIRVVGYPHREIENEMRAERIFINGRKFELRR